MINKVQPIRSLRAVIWYTMNDPAHDDSGQRYLMAVGEGCVPENAYAVMARALRDAGKFGKGIQGFSWVHSFDLSEVDPSDPEAVEGAMNLVREASRRRTAGDPPKAGLVVRKLFVAQADGKSGLLHIHEVELNLLEQDVEYTTTLGSRTFDDVEVYDVATREPITRMRGATTQKVPKSAKAGGTLPPAFRDVFRARRIANTVYREHTGRSNDDLMRERRTATMTWNESIKALVDHYVSLPEVKADGLSVLEAKMASEGHLTHRRGTKQTRSWVTTTKTGSQVRKRWSSLGPQYTSEALTARLAQQEPIIDYPNGIQLTRVQLDRLQAASEAETATLKAVEHSGVDEALSEEEFDVNMADVAAEITSAPTIEDTASTEQERATEVEERAATARKEQGQKIRDWRATRLDELDELEGELTLAAKPVESARTSLKLVADTEYIPTHEEERLLVEVFDETQAHRDDVAGELAAFDDLMRPAEVDRMALLDLVKHHDEKMRAQALRRFEARLPSDFDRQRHKELGIETREPTRPDHMPRLCDVVEATRTSGSGGGTKSRLSLVTNEKAKLQAAQARQVVRDAQIN